MRPAAVRTQRKSSNSPKISTSPGGISSTTGALNRGRRYIVPASTNLSVAIGASIDTTWRDDTYPTTPSGSRTRKYDDDAPRTVTGIWRWRETQRLATGGRAAAQCTVGDLYASPATHHSRVGRHERRLAPRLREKMTRINGSLAARIKRRNADVGASCERCRCCPTRPTISPGSTHVPCTASCTSRWA